MAEGTPLLRVQTSKTGLGGSNPPFSAIFFLSSFYFPLKLSFESDRFRALAVSVISVPGHLLTYAESITSLLRAILYWEIR